MNADRKERRERWLMTAVLAGMLIIPVVALGAVRMIGLLTTHRCPPSLETNAVGSARAYAEAQTMYKRNDWDGDGQLEYATDYTRLNTELDGSGIPIDLIDPAFVAAKGYSGTPKHGYLFKEMSTIGGEPIDPEGDFALCAIPATYARTGYRTFIVSTDGTVFGQDLGPGGTFVDDYPTDPTAEGWIIAE